MTTLHFAGAGIVIVNDQTQLHEGTFQAGSGFVRIGDYDDDATTVIVHDLKAALQLQKAVDALVYRMYEWAGKASEVKLHVAPGALYAVESNLMEKPVIKHLHATNMTYVYLM